MSFSLIAVTLDKQAGLEGTATNDWLEDFNKIYKCNLEQDIKTLWIKHREQEGFRKITENKVELALREWVRKIADFYSRRILGNHWYRRLNEYLKEDIDLAEYALCRNWADQALYAVVNGPADNPEAVRVLITRFGANPFQGTPSRIHWAARRGHISIVRLLITEFNVDPNVKNAHNSTPLHYAAGGGYRDYGRMLPTEFANPNVIKFIDSPYTAEGRHTELARMLITEYGANPNAKNNLRFIPLHYAARCGNTKLARMLITEFKADPNAKNIYGSSPLHYAAENGHTALVRMLASEFQVKQNSKKTWRQETPLHLAAQNGHTALARMLIAEFNADPNLSKTWSRDTPLHLAARHGHTEFVRMLITEFNVEPNTLNTKGERPVDLVKDNARLLELLKSYVVPDL